MPKVLKQAEAKRDDVIVNERKFGCLKPVRTF